jgi:flagellar hook-associated protein 2
VYTVASSQLLGETQSTSALSTAGLSTPITANGSFQINGVSIAWADTDSLSDVVSRINSSAAGATATYDPKLDKISLTNSQTGAQNISLVDGAPGGLLAALKLTSATQTYGSPAEYTTTQNGVTSATQFSNSNTVTGVVQGVNLTLLGTGTTSVSTTQDTDSATKNLSAFVTQFNATVDLLDTSTKYDSNTKIAGVLTGDSSITGLASQLRSLVSRSALVPAGSAYSTLGDIGISTGAYGSAIGSTNHLVLDTVKLGAALQNNPQAVMQVLAGLTGTSTAVPSGTPWMASASGSPYAQVNSGTYKVSFDPNGNKLSSQFTSSSGVISPAVTGSIMAGGINSTLIPGISIAAFGTLPGVSSTDTINYAVSGKGVLQALNGYIAKVRGPSGIFVSQHNNATASMAGFTAQIANQNQMLAQRQATLQKQFTAMEVALSSLQAQGASLASSMSSLSSSQSSSNN